MAVPVFPSQKRSTAEKTEQFYKDCIDAAIAMLDYEDDSGLRASMKEKRINNDLANNKLDPADVESVVNPWRVKGYDFPLEMRNYPLLKPKIDLLVGEEAKRRFDWRVVVRNSEAVSEKEKMIRDRYLALFQQFLTSKAVDENDVKKKVAEVDRWRKYEAKDIRERMASEVLTYQYDKLRMPYHFNMGMENALIHGEEIYSVNFIGNEVEFQRENPLTFTTLRSANTPFIEDSDIFISESYLPLGKVIDMYYDELTPTQIDQLEEAYKQGRQASLTITPNLVLPHNYHQLEYGEDIEIIDFGSMKSAFSGAFDESGNVRVVRVVWAGFRKIGRLKYKDEDEETQYLIVDENFEPNEELGQEVEWLWVKEYLQGVQLADDIKIAMRPVPRIGMSPTNPSKCMPPFVGSAYTIGDNTAMSMMSYGRPYQYIFNATMHRTEKLVITSHGSVAPLPLHLIPDKWELDDWLYYFSFLNFYVYDAFKEGNKGAAMGKLAGNMQQIGGDMRFDNAAQIQQNLVLLNTIKAQLDELTGITPQRMGQVEQRESVGGVERSVTQSSTITERWFYMHENTKLRAMELVLEATKVAWMNNKFKRQTVLSDMSSLILEFDGELLASAEYGIFTSNTTADQEIFAAIKNLVQPALQAKILKFSDIMGIFLTKSLSQVRRDIQEGEEEAMTAAQQQFQEEQKKFMAELEQRKYSEDKMIELKKYIAELQEETKRMAIAANGNAASNVTDELDHSKLELNRLIHQDDVAQKEKDRDLTERMHEDDIAVKREAINKRPAAKTT